MGAKNGQRCRQARPNNVKGVIGASHKIPFLGAAASQTGEVPPPLSGFDGSFR